MADYSTRINTVHVQRKVYTVEHQNFGLSFFSDGNAQEKMLHSSDNKKLLSNTEQYTEIGKMNLIRFLVRDLVYL